MSDASFLAEIGPYAAEVAHATGLDCRLFMVQWALESAWGTSGVAHNNNFAGIENSAGHGCTVCDGIYTCCPTIADFEALYLAILDQGIYAPVRATAGQSLAAQFRALGASPWAASHYATGCGSDGCELINLYAAQRSLFDAAAASSCGTDPCTGVVCPPGDTCVAGVCVPPVSPPPSHSVQYIAVGATLLGLAAFGIWEATRHPQGTRVVVAHLEGGVASIGGIRAADPAPGRSPRPVAVHQARRVPARRAGVPMGTGLGAGLERRR